jgi:hypothetical protein
MDTDYEKIVVKTFFSKHIQERVLFELASAKRRKNALNRLCHDYEKVLNQKHLIEISHPNSNYLDIIGLLKKEGAKDLCYSMSFNEEIDGKYLPLIIALEQAVGFGFPSIVSCIPDRLGYFEAEKVIGAPPRFILRNNNPEF